MNPSVAPLPPPPFCNSGYGGHSNQIPPHPSMAPPNPPGPCGNFPAPPAPYHGNCYHRPPNASIPNEGYQLQPPPPLVPPNFPCAPPEPQQRPHHWGNNCSSYPERYRYNNHDRGHHRHDRRPQGHDQQHHFDDRGYHYDDRAHYFDDRRHHLDDREHNFDERAIRGPMNHDAAERGRFPSFPPGKFISDGHAMNLWSSILSCHEPLVIYLVML
jgi:hypothetical protein